MSAHNPRSRYSSRLNQSLNQVRRSLIEPLESRQMLSANLVSINTKTVPDRVKLQLHAPLYVLSQFDVH